MPTRLSVRLSVRLSHSVIASKRLNVSSMFFRQLHVVHALELNCFQKFRTRLLLHHFCLGSVIPGVSSARALNLMSKSRCQLVWHILGALQKTFPNQLHQLKCDLLACACSWRVCYSWLSTWCSEINQLCVHNNVYLHCDREKTVTLYTLDFNQILRQHISRR